MLDMVDILNILGTCIYYMNQFNSLTISYKYYDITKSEG